MQYLFTTAKFYIILLILVQHYWDWIKWKTWKKVWREKNQILIIPCKYDAHLWGQSYIHMANIMHISKDSDICTLQVSCISLKTVIYTHGMPYAYLWGQSYIHMASIMHISEDCHLCTWQVSCSSLTTHIYTLQVSCTSLTTVIYAHCKYHAHLWRQSYINIASIMDVSEDSHIYTW